MKSLSLLASLVILLTLLFSCGGSSNSIPERPKPYKLYNDISSTNFLTKEQAENIETKLKEIKNEGQYEVAILVINELHGFEPSEFAIKTGAKWGLGTKEKDNGILILIKNEGKKTSFIATGRGAEITLTDIQCKVITENVFKPNFKNKDYYKGILAGLNVIRQSYITLAVPTEAAASDNAIGSSNNISQAKNKSTLSNQEIPITQRDENNIWILFLSLGIFIYIFGWLFFGLDPKKGKILPLEDFQTDLSPALINAIFKQDFNDKNIFIFSLISLQMKGFVSINFITKTISLSEQIFDSHIRKKNLDKFHVKNLPFEELFILEYLLKKGVRHFEIPSSYDFNFKLIVNDLMKVIESNYKKEFFSQNLLFSILGCLSHILSLYFFYTVFGIGWSILYFIILVLILGIMLTLIPKYTKKGRQYMDQLESYKLFLNDFKQGENSIVNMELFINNLPYALAIEEAENWFKKMNEDELLHKQYSVFFTNNDKFSGDQFNSLFTLLSDRFTKAIKEPSRSSSSSGSGYSSSDSSGGGGGDFGGGGGDFGGGGAGSDW
jgi:uncharacterized membrane protein YgcG